MVQTEKDKFLLLWNALITPPEYPNTINLENNDPHNLALFIKELQLKHISLTNIKQLDNIVSLHDQDKVNISTICQFLSSPDIGITMMRQILEKGFLSIEIGDYKCNSSITMGLPNFLIYRNGSDTIIVVQHLFSTIGVFFAKHMLSISWAEWDVSFPHWINRLIEYLIKEHSSVSSYLLKNNKIFSGVRIGIHRPYHQIYDQLVAFQSVMEDYNNGVCDFPIWMAGNQAFLSSKAIYGPDFNEIIIKNTTELNNKNFTDGSFSFLFGVVNFSVIGKEKTLKCFDKLKIHAQETMNRDPNFVSRLASLKKCSPVIWVGISAQKRIWIEQEDGLTQIIKKLHERFPSLGVIFDGWTAPIHPSESDQNEISADIEIMNRIIQNIPKNIHTESIIGATSIEKIAFGNNVDFYITNLITGSLHVDNICKKSGIGHMNKIWQGYVNSIYHNNCLRIDDEYITHCGEGSADQISYSIPWEKVYERLCELIDSLPMTTDLVNPTDVENHEM